MLSIFFKPLLLFYWFQLLPVYLYTGPQCGALGSATTQEHGKSWVRLPCVLLTKSFRQQYGPGVDLDSNRSEYQEYFLGRPVVKADKLTTFMCRLYCNLETSAPKKLQGISRPAQELLYLYNHTFRVPHLLYLYT